MTFRLMKSGQVATEVATAAAAANMLTLLDVDGETVGPMFDGIHPDDRALFERMTELRPVRAWQFHAVLRASGLADDLGAALAGLGEPDQSVARARLEYSDTYDRFDPLVAQLGAAMGMAASELDDLWRQAAALGNAA